MTTYKARKKRSKETCLCLLVESAKIPHKGDTRKVIVGVIAPINPIKFGVMPRKSVSDM